MHCDRVNLTGVADFDGNGKPDLIKAGWSWGCVSAIDINGRTIWIADAHRDNGKRFVVHADEMLTALVELESAIRVACRWYFSRVACYSPPLHPAVHILCKNHMLIRGSDVPM